MFLQVLEEDQHQLRLQVKHKRETTEFKSKLALYYYRVIERIFIVIVLIDAVLTATKFSGINTTHAEFLKYWQVCAMAKHDIVYMPCMCQYNMEVFLSTVVSKLSVCPGSIGSTCLSLVSQSVQKFLLKVFHLS